MSPSRLLRNVHVVSTLIVGLQLAVWTCSGLAFTLFDFDEVRGVRDRAAEEALDVAAVRVSAADAVARAGGGPAFDVKLRMVGGRATYVVGARPMPVLVDAATGDVRAIALADACAIAARAFRAEPGLTMGVGDAIRVDDAKEAPDLEVPVYRVRLADPHATEVYVSATTGEIVAWRNVGWRNFDLLYSLHVFAYVQRDSPVQWPLRVAALVASVAAVSGLALLVTRVRRTLLRRTSRERARALASALSR